MSTEPSRTGSIPRAAAFLERQFRLARDGASVRIGLRVRWFTSTGAPDQTSDERGVTRRYPAPLLVPGSAG
jgi:hypothetical protein